MSSQQSLQRALHFYKGQLQSSDLRLKQTMVSLAELFEGGDPTPSLDMLTWRRLQTTVEVYQEFVQSLSSAIEAKTPPRHLVRLHRGLRDVARLELQQACDLLAASFRHFEGPGSSNNRESSWIRAQARVRAYEDFLIRIESP